MRTHKIAAIPADGIGQEVIRAGLAVLSALAEEDDNLDFEIEHFDWGSDRYKTTGRLMPEDGVEQLKQFDSIFFGGCWSTGCARSYYALGLATGHLPTTRSIRQRASCPNLAWNHQPPPRCHSRKPRLDYRARKF